MNINIKVQDVYAAMSTMEMRKMKGLIGSQSTMLAGEGSDQYVADLFQSMGKIAKEELVRLLTHDQYISQVSLFATNVEEWYEAATEGQREHMANKLAKHSYPLNGKHNHNNIYYTAYAAGRDSK